MPEAFTAANVTGVLTLLEAVRRHLCMISRLRLDARLFAPAPPRTPHTIGRPRRDGGDDPGVGAGVDDRGLVGAGEVGEDPDREGLVAGAGGEGGDDDLVEGESEGEQGAGQEGRAEGGEGDQAEGLGAVGAEFTTPSADTAPPTTESAVTCARMSAAKSSWTGTAMRGRCPVTPSRRGLRNIAASLMHEGPTAAEHRRRRLKRDR